MTIFSTTCSSNGDNLLGLKALEQEFAGNETSSGFISFFAG
jgi:hypothetical protein